MIDFSIKKELHSTDGNLILDINTHFSAKKLTAIFGKSGAGKTTILRILAGLSSPDSGEIIVDGEVWYSSQKNINVPPQKRKIGFVFQNYALFPHLTVEGNLLFALNKQNKEGKKRVEELLAITELTHLANLKPNQLSGGQQQRVALVRALVLSPKILLLDEPFSALDTSMSLKLQEELLRIHKYFSLTTFLISHNLSEVFMLSDYVIYIKKGKITESGTPSDVFLKEVPSGKFRTIGQILEIKSYGINVVVNVLVGNLISQVVLSPNEIEGLKVGDRVLLSAKAWNTMLTPIEY